MWFVDQSQDPVIHGHGQLAESSGAVNGNHGASLDCDGSSSDHDGDGSNSDNDSDDPGLNYHGSFRLSAVNTQIQVEILAL